MPPIEVKQRNKDENPQEFEEIESQEEQSFRNEEEPVGRLLDIGPRVDIGRSISRSARSLRSSRQQEEVKQHFYPERASS